MWLGLTFLFGLLCGWLLTEGKNKFQRAQLESQVKFLEEKSVLLQKVQAGMVDQFRGISAEVLRQNQEQFLELAGHAFEQVQVKGQHEWEKREEKVGQLLKPVQQSLEKFDSKLEALEKARIGTEASLRDHLLNVVESQKHLRKETAQLVKALRTPHVRGRWGEVQLRRVVELAGMLEYCDFFEQHSVESEEGRLRPDLIIRLPTQKTIVVDAKAPLEAYLNAQELQDEDSQKQMIKEHSRQVRSHMSNLSRKSYWEQFESSPEFVVLFLPSEAFFSAALEGDPALIEGGAKEKVLIATPTTLIALLRAVAFGWRQERLSEQAEIIRDLGKELYKRLSDLLTHIEKLGKGLAGASEAYNRLVGSLESRYLPLARRFKDLEGLGIEKELPDLGPLEQRLRKMEKEELLASLIDPLQTFPDNKEEDVPPHSSLGEV